MAKSVVIIGAGIAGLAAGCYARMNGYDTLILEMHDKPGGLCTAWNRRGYTIDGCMHHLVGCRPDGATNRVWRELGALDDRPVLFRDRLVRIEDPEGRAYTVYTDLERLEQHLYELSPADRDHSAAFLRAARRLLPCEIMSMMSGDIGALATCLPRLGTMVRWLRVTMREYGSRFHDPFLQQAFPLAQYGFPDMPALIHLSFLAGCQKRDFGWPYGGSLEFARAMERRYRALGGEILYRVPVDRIHVEDGRATGVRVTRVDGSPEEYRADRVISAADAHATVYRMLGEPYVTDKMRRYFQAEPEHQEMTAHVSFGVKRDMVGQAPAITFLLPEPVTLAGRPCTHLDVEVYPEDTGLAAEGTSVIKAMLSSGYGYWSELTRDPNSYRDAKRRLADEVLAILERRLPGISGQVEMADVATPLTIERYTGNHHGYQVWPMPGAFLPKGVARLLPKIEGFHMVGQWATGSVGLSTAASAARRLIRAICRQDRRCFTTSESEHA